MEEKIVTLTGAKGPLTGSELLDELEVAPLELWRTCRLSRRLLTRTSGIRYLRLDAKVDGFARLSPSILREFMTYCVVGLPDDAPALDRRVEAILRHIKEVSQQKHDLARKIVHNVHEKLAGQWPRQARVCFILAGDIVYGMAHDVPRPERSTGKMVSGSDIDLIVVLDDNAPADFLQELDNTIYREKYHTLVSPSVREEIDYVVKKIERVREQLRFDSFKRMVACKILQEGVWLSGDQSLLAEIKAMLVDHGVTKKLEAMETEAAALRQSAEEYLLHVPGGVSPDDLHLFYTSEESEEFE